MWEENEIVGIKVDGTLHWPSSPAQTDEKAVNKQGSYQLELSILCCVSVMLNGKEAVGRVTVCANNEGEGLCTNIPSHF